MDAKYSQLTTGHGIDDGFMRIAAVPTPLERRAAAWFAQASQTHAAGISTPCAARLKTQGRCCVASRPLVNELSRVGALINGP